MLADEELVTAAQPPIFTLELGANGGTFSPTNGGELSEWVQKEIRFWAWLQATTGGNHRGAIEACLNPLRNASEAVTRALQSEPSSPEGFLQVALQAQSFLQDAYVNKSLPHSSSSLGKRVEQIRERDPLEAQAYLFPFLPSQGHQFDSRDVASWRGFLEGMSDRFGLSAVSDDSYRAALSSVEDLKARLETTLGKKTKTLSNLHRSYEELATAVAATKEQQAQDFAGFIKDSRAGHDEAMSRHEAAMANLEKVFREKMGLRAPVSYWDGRRRYHNASANRLRKWSFGSMAALALVIGVLAYWVLSNLTDGKPESWRVAVLGLVGILGVWAVRLVVRLFLSDLHLATDAGERVTMVKTYLSLLEADIVPSEEDRKIILQALFRPATDGIVKDEGLPHPALEALTRMGSR
ncbi:MAG: hypothetical protein JWR21_2377 [Herminiimonas sp.]|nr:hypothetical protein [Herminiimonas sp.]